jgi:hypothetical protein
MSSRDIVYVGSLATEAIADTYGINTYSLAGEDKKRNVISSLQSTGTSVTVVSPTFATDGSVTVRSGGRFYDEDLETPVHVPPLVGILGLSYPILAITTTFTLLSLLVRERPGAVVFYNLQLPTTVPAMAARTVFGVAAVLEYEDGMFVDPETAKPVRLFSEWLFRLFADRIDGAVCASGPLADRLPTTNTVVFRGFPSVGMPDELPKPSEDGGPPVVMFAGRFDDVRGIDTFLDAIPKVEERTDEVRFWVSGYGDDERCEQVAERVSTFTRATYFGTLPWEEYRQRIVSATVLVNLQDPALPISQYTFPSKLLDFMSAGRLIVSTDVGDIGSVFEDELIIVDDDPEAIADTISDCLEDDEIATEYGDRAEEWIVANCDRHTVATDLTDVVDTAVEMR